MKILFYINALDRGGAERAISNTASYFAEHEWDTILLTSFRIKHEYPYSKKVRRMSIENEQIMQSRICRNISRIRAIREICKSEKVDVAVSFMGEANFRLVLATAGLPVKTIVSVRNDPKQEYRGITGRLVGKYILPLADGAVFQTKEARDWFPKRIQIRSEVIFNVVDDKFYQTNNSSGTDIVTCGRIVPQKNHALLLRAFHRICENFPGVQLYIYGVIGENCEILELVEKLGLQNRVHLMGKTEKVESVLSGAGVFVLSSDYEGMPNALMEAMAVGVASISTDCPCGGPRELFGNELRNLLVPAGDEVALADKMVELLSDKEKRQEIGRKMRERAEEFRPEKIGAEWIAYVTSVYRK